MITFKVTSIDGLSELDAALRELPKALAKNVLLRVLKARAGPMADTMRSLAPNDPRTGPPDLKTSIYVSTRIANKVGHAEYSAVLRKGGSKDEARTALRDARRAAAGEGAFAEVYVGPDAKHFYGRMQEFGTVNHGPQPFMRPAWDQHQDTILEGIKDDFWKAIQAAAARRAKALARKAAKEAGGG